jgi:hypothetical protein
MAFDLPPDITPHVLRHSFASLAADLGYSEPTIASRIGHKKHSITSRYVHSADAVLLAAADAVSHATVKANDPTKHCGDVAVEVFICPTAVSGAVRNNRQRLIEINAPRCRAASVAPSQWESRTMPGLTSAIDQIGSSPPLVRYWLEQEIKWIFSRGPGENRSGDTTSAVREERTEPRDKATNTPESHAVAGDSDQASGAGPSTAEPSARGEALQRLIAERAYQLWENQGKPHGCDLIHWREAEQEIIGCSGRSQTDSARANANEAI